LLLQYCIFLATIVDEEHMLAAVGTLCSRVMVIQL